MTELVPASIVVRQQRLQTMNTFTQWALLLTLGALGFGCSAVVDASRVQCATDADCTMRGESFASTMCVESVCQSAAPWSCAQHAAPKAKSSAKVPFEFELFDPITQDGIVGVEASLCAKLSPDCAQPVGKTLSDEDGVVRLDMPPLFDGYVLLKRDEYDATMLFLPLIVESSNLGRFPLTSPLSTNGIAAGLGVSLMAGKGRVLLMLTGCDSQPAAGVIVEGEAMGADATRFYAIGGIPTFTAEVSDTSGFGGFINVTPGAITVNARLEDGTKIGRVGLVVRDGYVSIRRMQPWTD
jgi:hypothetical protein